MSSSRFRFVMMRRLSLPLAFVSVIGRVKGASSAKFMAKSRLPFLMKITNPKAFVVHIPLSLNAVRER
jgi:hypothetical protein